MNDNSLPGVGYMANRLEISKAGRPGAYDADKSKKSGSGWFSDANLKMFDLYQKVEDEYRVKTTGGGYLSIIGWIVVIIMLAGQTYSFITPSIHEHMVVDTTLGERLAINLDITFHALTCAEAHLDAMDVAGDNQLNMEDGDSMSKQRLSPTGEVIGEMLKSGIGASVKVETAAPEGGGGASASASVGDGATGKCLSCYGAESSVFQCCNTCQTLKDAYAAKGWSTADILKKSEQCLAEPSNPFANVKKGEGCRVRGKMNVNKVAGNIHIAHGESIVRDGKHIHMFLPQEAPSYNISHTIHSMSFGVKYPSMPAGPLDGITKVIDAQVGTGLFQYFIKVIPTIYSDEFMWGAQTYTNQYTVTERFRPLMLPDMSGRGAIHQQAVLPGIFFIYDVSPFLVEVVRSRTPFLHYFTRVCSTIGGVFAVMGVVDKAWYALQRLRSHKSSSNSQ